MQYQLKPEFKNLEPEKLITYMVGEKEPFTLDSKPFKQVIPASKKGPEKTIEIKVASAAQLEKLAKFGSKLLEPVAAKKSNG